MNELNPVTYTDENPVENSTFQVPPRRWRREDQPDTQLTDAAVVSLIMSGRIKPRDMAILRAVWMYGVMTTGQIIRLIFHTLSGRSAEVVAGRRLNFLYKEYCLNRVFRGIGSEFVYTLDIQGSRLIQMEQKKRRHEDIKWSFKGVGEKLLLLDHSLGITEFGVNLVEATRAWPDGGGLRWYGEHVLVLKKQDGTWFNPDGTGVLRLGKHGLAFFLEWDQGTEKPATVGQKVVNYIEFLRNPDEWRLQFRRFPVILIPTTTPGRVEKILTETERRLRLLADDEQIIVLVTTHDQLTQQGVLGQVWYRAGQTEKADLAWGKAISLPQLMGAATQ